MFLQPYAAEVGVPVWLFGPLSLAMRGGAGLGSVVAHRAGRHMGAMPLIAGSTIITALCLAILGLAPARPTVVLFVVASVAIALPQPVLSDLLNRELPSGQRATILSLGGVLSTLLLAVVEPVLFGLATRTSLAVTLSAAALVLLASTVPMLLLWQRAGRSRAELMAA
jgi:hypothetical protein